MCGNSWGGHQIPTHSMTHGGNQNRPFQEPEESILFELGLKKKLQVRKFNKTIFLDIREFFQKSET